MALPMDVGVASLARTLANSNIISASRILAIAPCLNFGGVGRFHCGVKSVPVYRDSSFLPRLEPNYFCGFRQGLRRGETGRTRVRQRGVAMKALGTAPAAEQVQVPLLRSLLGAMVKPYLVKNPTAVAALDLIRKHDSGPLCYDHFAFRTFGVDGCGIDAIAQVFLDLNYQVRDELRFPAKKLRALWFSPPDHLLDMEGSEVDGPLPRIFISEIIVDELSSESQGIIRKYTSGAAKIAKYAPAASVLNSLTWPTPLLADYQHLAKSDFTPDVVKSSIFHCQLVLAMHKCDGNSDTTRPPGENPSTVCGKVSITRELSLTGTMQLTATGSITDESEYAAWTLVNGYALNHTTVSVHRLGSLHNIEKLNEFLQENGVKLNTEGGILKVSPDGGLQQSSSVADSAMFTFAGGEVEKVPASYIEFAERLVLPIHGDLQADEIHERHRRDGFEVGNADKIFESTSADQMGMRVG